MAAINTSSELIDRIRSILTRQRLVLFFAGLFTTVAAAAAILVLLTLLANVVVLPVWFKISLLISVGLLILYVFGRYSIARLLTGNLEKVAVRLEQRYPELKGRLIATLQFAQSRPHSGFSTELLEATQQQTLGLVKNINFNEVVSFYPLLRTGRLFAGAVVLAFALIVLFPGLFSYSYEVYSKATTTVAPPLAYRVVPIPLSTEWIKYRDIRIGATVFGLRLPEKAYIHHRLAGGSWQRTRVDLAAVPRLTTAQGDSAIFGITLRQINRSFDFFVEAGPLKTDVQSVDVVDRPRVTGIKLSISYPEYTGLEPLTIDENNGSFSAVVGSRVNMKVTTNLPIETAVLVFEDSSRVRLEVENQSVIGALRIDKSRSYYISLLDHLGEKNPDPIEYYITAVPDEFPTVDVIRPGFDVNLSEEMLLPLKIRIFDDYGFSSLVLKYTVVSQGNPSGENVAILHFSERIRTEGEVEFNWDMEPLNLFPGDYVAYHLEVADNDAISGPKISRSRQYIARLPSLDELIAQSEGESAERISNAEELIRTGKDLVQRLKNVARKLDAQTNSGRKADWQQQKELETVTGKNAEMLERIEEMADRMQTSLEQMRENSLMSRQILEKLEQIQQLFEDIATPEMKEAQRRLMEALKNMDRQQIQDAMKDFQLSQEEMLQRLERTLALLKKLQLEQKMETMVRKAEQLAERQEAVNETTEAADKKQLPSMSPTEDEIGDDLINLKEEVSELRQLMTEAGMEQSPEAGKFAEAVEKTDADQDMQQMAQSMKSQKKSDAVEQGSKAYGKMMDMLGQMQEQLAAMQGGDSDQIKRAMRRALDDANYLSTSQEELLEKAAALDPQSLVLRDMANSQQDLVSACSGLKNRIAELGKQSPFVAAELRSLVNNAVQNMELACQEFENKRGPAGSSNQREAMIELNKASIRLMESLDQQNQCDNPNNQSQSMAQLEKLCNKQNQLNQQTQAQCNNPGSGKGKQGEVPRGALERLAGEQGTIRKSMEQLVREFGNSRQILGRLDDIAREMKDVEEGLASGDIGQEITHRQLKILSRMLEASRSLQRRDFSEQRKAATASEHPVYLPPTLSEDILNDKIELEDRLREFLGSGYPPQYEEQIKAYFRALLNVRTAPSESIN